MKLKPAESGAQANLRDDIHIHATKATVFVSKDWMEPIEY